MDFFGSAGRDRAIGTLNELDRVLSVSRGGRAAAGGGETGDVTRYHDRLWVTRPRPGVDRMASAWLIQRFIDPRARFDFAVDRNAVPEAGVPFDMFGVDFSHRASSP
jgi:hypothetical protein